jgi:hypothetical protein
VQKILVRAARTGARIEFFLKSGGSVSVDYGYAQDNYAFGTDGVVTGHKRSHGANYARGVWETVAP